MIRFKRDKRVSKKRMVRLMLEYKEEDNTITINAVWKVPHSIARKEIREHLEIIEKNFKNL